MSAVREQARPAWIGRREWVEPLLVALLGLVCIVVLDAFVLDAREPRGDELIYELMARHPFAAHTFPFAYRIGPPTLVHLLPFSHDFSWSALAWLCTGASAGVAYALMRRFGAERWLAAGLALCLATCPPLLAASLRQGRGVDAESVLVMLAGGLAIAARRPLALGVIVLLGAFVRESSLFLVPFAYAFWAERPLDWRAAREVGAAAAPGVAVYVGLRLALPTVGHYGGRLDLLRQALHGPLGQARRLASSFGPLWLAAPFALLDLRYARRGLVLLALCVLSMLYALDWGRVILLAAPVFYGAGAHVLRNRRGLAIAAVAAFAVMNVGYAIHMDRGGTERGIINGPLPSYPVR
jgi:hypothetical protein